MAQDLIPVCLKHGTTYQSVQIDKANPQCIDDLYIRAVEVLEKSIPGFDPDDEENQLKLFLITNDHASPSLKLVTRPNDLVPTCFVEIVIWPSVGGSISTSRDHELADHVCKKPTHCSRCNYFMWGLLRQGKRCKNCKADFHDQCAEHLPPNCPGEVVRRQGLSGRASSISTLSSVNSQKDKTYLDGDTQRVGYAGSHSPAEGKKRISNTGVVGGGGLMNASKPDTPKDIKLTNCQENNGIWTAQGQYDRADGHSKRVEIVFDKKKFQFIRKDENGQKEILELSLSDVEAQKAQSSSGSSANGKKTRSSTSTQSSSGSTGSETSSKAAELATIYQRLASLFLDMINEAARSSNDRKSRPSFKLVRGGKENATKEFTDLYDMNEKDILGEGRFGMVFGGTMRKNGVPVAIKKIKTEGFTQKERQNTEQEAGFLFQLSHPGILKFEGIFEFDQHIYLVTERLESNMLDYILANQNPKARLTEDTTRFLAFQLVAAIRYLHFKNIAHCDLKPDNVLINIFYEDIVHLKVGDFGYARTIREDSLRYTKVGTMAYLPPEVSYDQWRQERGYNKTVDMWAIGVIIFVSLSGVFPFRDNEDILPQLEYIPKFFKDGVLKKVTDDVKDLLCYRLLVPDAGHRMRSAGVIYHDWFQKATQLLGSCKRLEECLKKKWLTLFFEEAEPTDVTGNEDEE